MNIGKHTVLSFERGVVLTALRGGRFGSPRAPKAATGFMVKCDDGSMSTNPMRRIVERQCGDCDHVYIQAALTGACPNCHGENVANIDVRACAAPYRK